MITVSKIAKLIAWFLAGLVGLFVALVIAQGVVTKLRGYQLVTLKTRMYWDDDGKAVRGDKVKTWRIAIPNEITLFGTAESWAILPPLFGYPVYGNAKNERNNGRTVGAFTAVERDGVVLTDARRLQEPVAFTLIFSNQIPWTGGGGGFRWYTNYKVCSVDRVNATYHGWIVGVPAAPFSDDRICEILTANLDHWTLHIDDLTVKDSGE